MQRGMRRTRRIRPAPEGLEQRTLLDGTPGMPQPARQDAPRLLQATTLILSQTDRHLVYVTPQGARVELTLSGPGTLEGTAPTPDGVLHIIYDGTDTGSIIRGTVSGGTRRARLGSIRDADIPRLDDLTGRYGNLLRRAELPQFDLVDGGQINLLGGVNVLALNSVGRNTQIHLRDTPLSFGDRAGSDRSDAEIPSGTDTDNGQNTRTDGLRITTPGLSQTAVRFGRVLRYAPEIPGNRRSGRFLASVEGTFTPGRNLLEPQDPTKPGPPPAPPGVVLRIDRVDAGPRNGLSTSIPPDLDAAALIDVQGNVQSFRAGGVRGLVLNVAGNLNVFQVHQQVIDSTIIGLPITRVAIGQQSNTTFFSSQRRPHLGAPRGVTFVPQPDQVGPLPEPRVVEGPG